MRANDVEITLFSLIPYVSLFCVVGGVKFLITSITPRTTDSLGIRAPVGCLCVEDWLALPAVSPFPQKQQLILRLQELL